MAADGRCFDVAVDHGLFNEPAFLTGIEDLEGTIRTLVAAGPDAIQLAPGPARLLQHRRGKKPALVLRTDVANVYGAAGPLRGHLFSQLIEDAAEQAVRLDAACVCVNLLFLPDHPGLHRQCVENVIRLRHECDSVGMPMMVEPLAMRVGENGYRVDGTTDTIRTLVRQAVELGADVVKADPTDQLDDYERVIAVAAGTPVLVRGGGRVSDDELISRTESVLAQGASGIVYGRNVIQHEDPVALTRRLMEIVHGG